MTLNLMTVILTVTAPQECVIFFFFFWHVYELWSLV